MAKKSAHGKVILAVEKIGTTSEGEWSRDQYSFHEDGKALSCYTVQFAASQYQEARKHSYGWKLWRKFDVNKIEAIRAKFRKLGYVEVLQ